MAKAKLEAVTAETKLAEKKPRAKAEKPEGGNASESTRRILQSATTIHVHRSKIKFADYNPRTISAAAFRKLCGSIKRYGIVEPPVVNQTTGNTIVGGHQRVKALDKVLGTTDYEIAVNQIAVDIATEKSLNVILNNPTTQGEYDAAALQELIGEMVDAGSDIEATGFTETDLQLMFDDAFMSEAFKSQHEAESEDVETLNEIREVGEQERKREAEQRKQAASREDSSSRRATDSEPQDGDGEDGLNLSEKRKKYRDQRSEVDDADTIVTLVFRNSRQLAEFLARFGLDQSSRYFPADEFIEITGLQSALADSQQSGGDDDDGQREENGFDPFA